MAFILLSVPAVWLAPQSLRRLVLLLACLIFHARYAGPAGMMPIVVLAALTYFSITSTRFGRTVIMLACVFALLYYKYTAYLNELLGTTFTASAAPLAISFFVFEFVHLLSDKNRSKLRSEVAPLDFSLFTIFFPALASGPIKRYQQFVPELARLGRPSNALLAQALVRILFGYYKKFCLADALAVELPAAESIEMWKGSVSTLALLQGLRIFLDFSGYSDLAIGFAGLLNIRLPENFSFPYLATNISEFWRRWHISLSTWIRDYVYILLGGNRVSKTRMFANLMAAMILCGLWHGAATHFIAWGMAHGLALLLVHFWRSYSPLRVPAAIGWCLTFVYVQASWLVFFYDLTSIRTLLEKSPII